MEQERKTHLKSLILLWIMAILTLLSEQLREPGRITISTGVILLLYCIFGTARFLNKEKFQAYLEKEQERKAVEDRLSPDKGGLLRARTVMLNAVYVLSPLVLFATELDRWMGTHLTGLFAWGVIALFVAWVVVILILNAVVERQAAGAS